MTYRVLAMLLLAIAAAGCTDNAASPAKQSSAPDTRAVSVQASDTACTLSAVTAPAGTISFTVTNTGAKTNEFYLVSADGAKVIGEVEDIGPGLSRNLVVDVSAGDYLSVCKPGMAGDGIRAAFTVTGPSR